MTNTGNGGRFPSPLRPRAVIEDGWVFVAGVSGFDHDTQTWPDGIAAQCDQAFANAIEALAAVGGDLRQAVRITYLLADPEDWAACLPVIARRLGSVMPAATVLDATMPIKAMKLQLEVTLRLPD